MTVTESRANDQQNPLPGPTYGVVDIGSNTVHLLVARSDGHALTSLVDESVALYLGNDLERGGAIGEEKLNVLVQTLRRFQAVSAQAGVDELRLLATEAVRAATNREEICRLVTENTHLPLEVLSPEREAELAYLGACAALQGTGPQAMLDIGGGSAQVVVGLHGRARGAASMPLGSSRLAAQFLRTDPPSSGDLDSLSEYLSRVVPPALPLVDSAPRVLLGVGGTLRRLPPLLGLNPGEVFPADWLTRILILLGGKSADEVAGAYGVTADQARLILPAALLLAEVARGYQDPPLSVVGYGVREGAILSGARRYEENS